MGSGRGEQFGELLMSNIRKLLEAHAASDAKLTVHMVSTEVDETGSEETTSKRNYALIEGDSASLQFLGEILLACAEGHRRRSSFGLHPQGDGRAHFSETSSLGLYFHNTDSPDEELPDSSSRG